MLLMREARRVTRPFSPIRRCIRASSQDHALLERLVADAPLHLAPGGLLQIVVQRRLPLDRLFPPSTSGAPTWWGKTAASGVAVRA